MRSLFVWAAILASLAAAVVARPFLIRRAKPRPRFEYSRRALDAAAYAALAARPAWSAVTLPVDDQATLRGLMRRPAQPGAKWVVFFPGNDHEQLARGQRVLEYIDGGNGFGLLVVADRGFDASTGEANATALAADGTRILDVLVKGEHVNPASIHVVGFSLGGFVACSAVAAAAKAGQPVASLSLLASVTFVEMSPSSLSARIMIGDTYDTLAFLPDVPAPVLLVHGTADQALPIEGSQDMARRLGAKATFVAIPGAPHQLTDEHAALDQVRSMIDRSARR